MGLQWRQADVSISISKKGLCGLDGRVRAQRVCMLLYLAKKQRSIVGHKECVEGSIVRQEPCGVGMEGGGGDQWQALSH